MALFRLPDELRGELKDPLGPVRTEIPGDGYPERVVAVGDIVTATLLEAGVTPDVAVVDGRTKRERVDPSVVETTRRVERSVAVDNPAGTVTAALVDALREALAADAPTRIEVDGEEDLAALPAVVLAEDGDTVVYGQPDEGMVHVAVDGDVRRRVRELLGRMETDEPEAAAALVGDGAD